jgi:hypothetical protein
MVAIPRTAKAIPQNSRPPRVLPDDLEGEAVRAINRQPVGTPSVGGVADGSVYSEIGAEPASVT